MKNTNGISMISLIITILLMIILASISGYYLTSTINDAEYKDLKEDMRNVESVVEYAKTQILMDEFEPNESFAITDAELEDKFGSVLTEEEKNLIKSVNGSASSTSSEKYYLMTPDRFDQEFGNEFNVNGMRDAREYLVNYMDTVVVCNYSGKLLASKNIIQSPEVTTGSLKVVFEPDGNAEWLKQQTAKITLTYSNLTVQEAKYVWSQSYTEPTDSDFASSYAGSVTLGGETDVEIDSVTGNDWYLWIRVKYTENDGREKVYTTRSRAFCLDNENPTGTLEVEDINLKENNP